MRGKNIIFFATFCKRRKSNQCKIKLQMIVAKKGNAGQMDKEDIYAVDFDL